MIKLNNKIIIILLAIILGCGLFVTVSNNNLKNKNSIKAKTNEVIVKFSGLNMNKSNIKIYYEGKKIDFKLPIYEQNNRYYLPVNDIIKKLSGEIFIENNKLYFKLDNYKVDIDLKVNAAIIGDKTCKFRQNIIVKDEVMYMNLFDLTKVLNLKTKWVEEKKLIDLYKNRDEIQLNKVVNTSGKMAFIRIEDITSAQRYKTGEGLEKLRIMSDYLYSQDVPFHVGWVPRYLDPSKNIDEDPSRDHNIHNANFVYTMDYFIDRGGIIGLHGYTHQYGNEISIDGVEFDGNKNTSAKNVRNRIELAIKAAQKLNIPYLFFESPHYCATDNQHRIIEEFFKYIYEPPKFAPRNNIRKRILNGKEKIYIPAPLNYVDGKHDTNNMIAKINNLKEDTLASFFYHPNIEFEYIKLYEGKSGYPTYKYDDKSPLKRIINTFISKGYKFKKITDIK